MGTFLLCVLLLICLGILIRIFWVPLLFIAGFFYILTGITVCAGVTALTLEIIAAMCTDGTWTGFLTYFAYSFAFYTVMMIVYMTIVANIVGMAIDLFRSFIRKI